MGTSASSKGPGGGVPLIPPWVEPVEDPVGPGGEPEGDEDPQAPSEGGDDAPEAEAAPKNPVPVIAPSARFKGARTSLGHFSKSGSQKDLASGLGHYVRSGLGGAGHGTRRLSGTARTAGKLYGALEGFRQGEAQPPELGIDRASLAGRPAREIGDRIADALCPIDGTQDIEARRDSLARAIAELANEVPDLDLTELTQDQIDLLIERFVSHDLCKRIQLDVGKAVFDKAQDAATAVRRLEEMRRYVQEKVSASFRGRRQRGERLTRAQAAKLTAAVIRDTLDVFEDYVR